jgi:hypothetical protein
VAEAMQAQTQVGLGVPAADQSSESAEMQPARSNGRGMTGTPNSATSAGAPRTVSNPAGANQAPRTETPTANAAEY